MKENKENTNQPNEVDNLEENVVENEYQLILFNYDYQLIIILYCIYICELTIPWT